MRSWNLLRNKILMGPERKSIHIDKANKTITAYHESAMPSLLITRKMRCPSIRPRSCPGPTLGHVSMLPENDRWSETRSAAAGSDGRQYGCRVAEELIFGDDYITTEPPVILMVQPIIAKMMVTRFGMSDKLGVMTYGDVTKQSPETQAAIEQEVRVLLKDSYERAKNLLKTYSKEHKELADALLAHETLDAKDIKLVLEGKSLEH
ncbi:unnamed protein product [Pleuronectes platessa]|uniref:Peptidase M41 domain-containing protein n=1 Tax=Pleuronectes platessa TaxID=8262 RepID=A0A9N7V3J4_PLEPL|nr:unnamed protein product [Pleuronectes platessa]